MKSFNLASQLVGEDFAERLPDAMGYLGKVSAATGEDMSFMMNSLVRGIGRLSPMILDNLGIQVDLTEAYEIYAKEMGIAVDEMSKTEQQTALMNQVMLKLAKNTADMPDIVGTTAQQFESFKVTLKDAKNEIGLALLPVLSALLQQFQPFIQQVLPKFVELFKVRIVPALLDFIGEIRDIGEYVLSIGKYFLAVIRDGDYLNDWLTHLPMKWREPLQKAGKLLAGVFEFVTEHKDEIIGAIKAIGAALAAAAIFATISKIATVLGKLTSPIGIIMTLIGLFGAAWKGNWGGIRDTITAFWEKTGRPIFEKLRDWLVEFIPRAIEYLKMLWIETLLPALERFWSWVSTVVFPIIQRLIAWLAENIPIAIETLKTYWEETLLPAIQNVWKWVQENVFPIIETLVAWLAENIPIAIETLSTFWEDTLLPAIKTVWDWVKENVFPIIEDLFAWLGEHIPKAIEDLSAFWTDTLRPAIESVWKWMSEHLFPFLAGLADFFSAVFGKAIEAFAGLWENVLLPALTAVWKWVKEKLTPVFEFLKGVFDGITEIMDALVQPFHDLADIIRNLKLPDWLTPGSMTPLEKGLIGIRDAMLSLSGIAMPNFAMATQQLAAPSVARQTTNNFNLNVSTMAPREQVVADFQMLAAMSERT